jgi:hypothetical protein
MESSTKSTTRHVEANVNRQKENHDNQNISNEVEDAIICYKSASDGGALRKENQDNQNRSKKVEDAIVCHKSASDGGALQKENQDNQNNSKQVEDIMELHYKRKTKTIKTISMKWKTQSSDTNQVVMEVH